MPDSPHTAPVQDDDAVLNEIAAMMGEFVDNWPKPKRVKTALALIAKAMRAALTEHPVPIRLAGLEGAGDWEVGPCVDRLGHTTSWDINIKPEPGAKGVPVMVSERQDSKGRTRR